MYGPSDIISTKTGNESNFSNSSNHTNSNDNIFPNTILLSGPPSHINHSDVNFTWTGVDDNTATENLSYSCKLEGMDDSWSVWSADTSIIYTKLSNGDYVFFVKAKNQEGNVDPTPAKKEFTVRLDEEEPKSKIFYVYWPIQEKNLPLDDSFHVEKNEPFTRQIKIPQSNLKSVTFKLTWKDDITTPLLHFGKDTLTFSIEAPDDKKLFKKESIGNGTILYIKDNINDKPEVTEIESENLSTAQVKLIQEYYNTNWENKTIQLNVNLKVGEISILRRLMEQGNNFKLEISYEYYNPELSEKEDNPPDTRILSGPTGTIKDNTVTFSWIGSDDISSSEQLEYSYKLLEYDTEWSQWKTETSTTYSDLPDGEYTFFIITKDFRGNIDPTPANQTFKIDQETEDDDTTSPDTNILSGPTGTIYCNTVTFTWDGSDDKTSANDMKFSYYLTGEDPDWSDWITAKSKTYANLSTGNYTFQIKTKDKAFNIDPTPATRSFTVINRFATRVIEFNNGTDNHPDYNDPYVTLGGPCGLGDTMGSLHVLSLGINGNITLGFDVNITNGPGMDFVVFENPFHINNQSGKVYAELMYVEISTDGVNFARFPSISNTPCSGSIYPDDVTNLAGIWPVYANVDTNDIDPFNPNVTGGDAFDLQDLNSNPLVQSGLVNLQNINYIRLIDILGDGSNLDSRGNPIYDPTDMDNGADIDAISIINYMWIE